MNLAAKLENRPLPTGWICRQSKSRNKQYYFNTVTGESSWKHPLDDEISIHVSDFWINKSSITTLHCSGSVLRVFLFSRLLATFAACEALSCGQLNKVSWSNLHLWCSVGCCVPILSPTAKGHSSPASFGKENSV